MKLKKTSSAKNSLKSLLKFKTTHRYQPFSLLQPSETASSSNSRWQNLKERPNRSTHNGDMAERANVP